VLLEHASLAVESWTDELQRFWFEALGCVSDPRAVMACAKARAAGGPLEDLRWVNIGLQQLHVSIGETVLPTDGILGLAFTSLHNAKWRFTELGVPHELEVTEDQCLQLAGPRLRLRSPSGDQVRIHGATDWFGPEGAKEAGCCPPGGPSLGLGLQYLEFACPMGSSAGIGRFYRVVMGIPVVDLGGACKVPMNTGQFLLFRETKRPMPTGNNPRVTIYVGDLQQGDMTESFSKMYQRCKRAGVIYNNPTFPRLTYDTLEDALTHNEFRVLHIVDPAAKIAVCRVEHEIRALTHLSFSCKQLLWPRSEPEMKMRDLPPQLPEAWNWQVIGG